MEDREGTVERLIRRMLSSELRPPVEPAVEAIALRLGSLSRIPEQADDAINHEVCPVRPRVACRSMPQDVILLNVTPGRMIAVIAVCAAALRRIAATGCLAAMLAVVLPAALQPSPAVALEHATSSDQPTRDARSRRSPAEDPACPGFNARDLSELRDSSERRAEIDELCHTIATMKYAHRDPFPVPIWVLVVLAVVGIPFTFGIYWYAIVHDTDVPWPWRVW
jgi:hypothetical protein